jgi:hypothetical protein
MTIVLDLSLAMCCQNCSPSSLGLKEAIVKLAWWLNRGISMQATQCNVYPNSQIQPKNLPTLRPSPSTSSTNPTTNYFLLV